MMQMDLDLNTLMQKAYEIRRQFPVDDIGTIHVRWDCGSSLGVVYPEDKCEIIY